MLSVKIFDVRISGRGVDSLNPLKYGPGDVEKAVLNNLDQLTIRQNTVKTFLCLKYVQN